jgi:hypothetical protein
VSFRCVTFARLSLTLSEEGFPFPVHQIWHSGCWQTHHLSLIGSPSIPEGHNGADADEHSFYLSTAEERITTCVVVGVKFLEEAKVYLQRVNPGHV